MHGFRIRIALFFMVCLASQSVSSALDIEAGAINLLANPGFEEPEIMMGIAGWEVFNTAGVQDATTHTGTQALRLAANAPTGTGDGIARQTFFTANGDVQINQSYSFGAWIYNNMADPLTGDRRVQLRIQWFNEAGFMINQVIEDVADASTQTNIWQFVSIENLLLPNNPNIFEVRVAIFSTNAGGMGTGPIFVDNVTFVQGENAVTGGNVNLLNTGFELPDLMPPNNQAPGADFWETFNTAGVRTIFQHSGDQSLRLAPNAPTGTGHGICRQVFLPNEDIYLDTAYSMSGWVYVNSSDPLTGTRQAEFRVQWFNAGNNLLNQQTIVAADANTPTDEWIRVSLDNIVIPQNPNIAEIRIALFVVNNAGTGSGPVFFDDISFTLGETSTMYGDINGDGSTNLLDVAPFVQAVSGGTYIREADLNQDCQVNLLDVAPFVQFLAGG